MNIHTVNHHFSVSGPLTRDDIQDLASAGIRTLVNVRPDFEEPNQVPDAVLRIWAANAGLEYHFLPVASGQYTDSAVAAFGELLLTATAPLHATCRSGTRALHLWALARRRQGVAAQAIIDMGQNVGVDLRDLLTAHDNYPNKNNTLR